MSKKHDEAHGEALRKAVENCLEYGQGLLGDDMIWVNESVHPCWTAMLAVAARHPKCQAMVLRGEATARFLGAMLLEQDGDKGGAIRNRRMSTSLHTTADLIERGEITLDIPGDPRTDLTHAFYAGTGERTSFQGMRCKILRELPQGRVLVEFEKGDVIVVNEGGLKELPKPGEK